MTTYRPTSVAAIAAVLVASVAAGWGLQRAFSQNGNTLAV